TGRASYLQNTNVLRTEFTEGDARWEIIDFAPRVPRGGGRFDTPLDVIRLVRPLAGTPRIRVDFRPRPSYGRAHGQLLVTQHGVDVLDAGAPMHLYSNIAGDHIAGGHEVPLRSPVYFVLSYGNRSEAPNEASIDHLLA